MSPHAHFLIQKRLAPGGIVIPNSGHGGMSYVFKSFLISLFRSQHGTMFMANPNGDDMDDLREIIEAGKIVPIIDKTYPLEETPEALRYLQDEHARGKNRHQHHPT